MKKKLTTVTFKGTPEQAEKLDALIAANKDIKGAAMPVLQGAQEIYGYLPEEVIRRIAAGLGHPFEEIYGIATFYSQFSLNPKGDVAIAVCLGTACYVKGSGQVMERIEKKLNIEPGATTADGRDPLHRRVRSRTRPDRQRHRLRQTRPERRRQNPRRIPRLRIHSPF